MATRRFAVVILGLLVGIVTMVLGLRGAQAVPWTETDKLLADDGAEGDGFGFSVSVSGTTAFVGAWFDDDCGDLTGAAYVFEDNGTDWEQVAKLLASDAEAYQEFGTSVSVDGTTAVVGANLDDGGSGSAYVFEKGVSGWTEVAKLTASDGAAADLFGWAVCVSGTTAVVGAWGDDDDYEYAGAAYVFQDNGTAWVEVAKLRAADRSTDDTFGCSVAVSGTTVLVGSRYDDDCGSDSGSAYVFEDNGTDWVQVAKLVPSDGRALGHFGESVALSGTTALVGAEGDDDCGAYAGAAYVFEDNGTHWVQIAKLLASDAAAHDGFGTSVSVSGTRVLVGAPDDDDCGDLSGSGYIFEDNGTHWVQVAKLTASDGDNMDSFGFSVSLSGTTALLGAFANDDFGDDSGSAYIFEPIPEPASVVLLATGVLGTLACIRRRRMR